MIRMLRTMWRRAAYRAWIRQPTPVLTDAFFALNLRRTKPDRLDKLLRYTS